MLSPTIKLRYRLTIRDANGRVASRGRWRRSRSYVEQLTHQLLGKFSNVDVTIKDTGGTSRTYDVSNSASSMYSLNQATNALMGLVVGTGSTAVDISDYALGTQIAHGTGSGQMEYAAGAYSAHQVSGQTAQFTITRTFINSSGASITINEVGIYNSCHDGVAWRYYLIVRDVVSGGQAVANGQSATLEYTISVTA